jgi:hypothetical protein
MRHSQFKHNKKHVERCSGNNEDELDSEAPARYSRSPKITKGSSRLRSRITVVDISNSITTGDTSTARGFHNVHMRLSLCSNERGIDHEEK